MRALSVLALLGAACGEQGPPSPEGALAGSAGRAGSASGGLANAGSGAAAGAAIGLGGAASGQGGVGTAGTSLGGQAAGAGAGAGVGASGGVTANGGAAGAPADECDGAPPLDPALLQQCSGDSPITCVFGGEPGHYDVRLMFGGSAAGATIVEAESRRLMLGELSTAAGESRCLSLTINVRSPEGQPIQATAPHGTDGLNLRLLGAAPRLAGVGLQPAAAPIVLYIAGDSTVCDQDPQLEEPPNLRFTGWGQRLPQFFKRGVSVTNYADSGEGSAAFRTNGGGLWPRIGNSIKAGDFLFIQLGHNDKTTSAATYRANITGMVQAAKAKAATPVLITPIVRNNGSGLAEQQIYGELNVRNELLQIAETEQVPLIDLLEKSVGWVASIGRTTAQTYYVGSDSTHTNELGAQVFAELVVEGIREEQLALSSLLR